VREYGTLVSNLPEFASQKHRAISRDAVATLHQADAQSQN
jgi:hypothetical protein